MGNRKYYKYISSQHVSSNIKLASSCINNVKNVEIRYEYLKNANINNAVEYNSNTGTLRDVLLDIKIRTVLLLIGVEQRSGRKKNCIFLLMIPKLSVEVQY